MAIGDVGKSNKLLFLLFNMTCFGCARKYCILGNMTFWPYQMLYYQGFSKKKLAYLNVKCHVGYIMKIHKYERTFVLKKYAHKVPLHVLKY